MPESAETNSADPGLPDETILSAVSDSFPFYTLTSIFQLDSFVKK